MKNNQGFAPILIVLIVIGVLVLGGGVYYFLVNKTPKPVACTQEAKVCLDGSAVGRTGPNCEFAECPAVLDETADWKTYQNAEGGYLFKYPKEWNAVTNKYNSKNALFGPGATSESGYGGVEFSGTLLAGQSLKDFVKEFNKGVESGSISETEATVSGQAVVISILPKAATESTETKSVSFEKDGKVFNMYLMYKTNFTQYPEDEQRLTIFNQMLSTFGFIEATPTPVIDSISPQSGPVGTIIEIKGRNFGGFEGDLNAWIENANGVKGIIYGESGSNNNLIRFTLDSSYCQQDTSYSGLDCSGYLSLTTGVYKIYVYPWGVKSNEVNFTVTSP